MPAMRSVAGDSLGDADLVHKEFRVVLHERQEELGGRALGFVPGSVGDDPDDAAGAVFDDQSRVRRELFAVVAQDCFPGGEHEALDLDGKQVHAALVDEQRESVRFPVDERLEAIDG